MVNYNSKIQRLPLHGVLSFSEASIKGAPGPLGAAKGKE